MTHDDAIKLIESGEAESIQRGAWAGTIQRVWHVHKDPFFPHRRSLLWMTSDGLVKSWADDGPAEDKAATDWVASYPVAPAP